ncbi:MAG: pyruvate dehydrogenase E2 component (dihydrolipoamide acetyltransferase) [Flavobacteriaceae bacterium]|jgi:pyruvate dehydrogenase E2 component (dihydrolipoamide acetyltransferase)
MAEVINMPRLSDTMEEGTVAKWLKKVGEKIEEGDILAEIETDKATMEFESFNEGVLLHIGIEEGETALVDKLLCIIGDKDEDISSLIKGTPDVVVKKNTETKEEIFSEEILEIKESKSIELPKGVVVITMPRLSDTMTEGTVATWIKKEGDAVDEGDILAEIETDKATMEFESFHTGTLLKIGIAEGESAIVDSVLAIVGPKGTDVTGIIENYSSSETVSEVKEEKATPVVQETKKEVPVTVSQPIAASDNGRVFISPLAKKLAEEKGISLNLVKGSGENGRIIKRDIENYVPAASGLSQAYVPVGVEAFEEVKNSQMRKVIARRLGESKFMAPHYYLTVELDMDHAIAARKAINTDPEVKVSFNDMIVKACAMALRKHPRVNTQWTEAATLIAKHIHIGVAVAVEDGLLVPVLKFADQMTFNQIGASVKDLAGRARIKKLTPQEMEGSTFTVSNLGMFGIKEFTSIINQPNSAILSVGAIVQKPVVKNGQIAVGNTMTVTLACDHRTVDGATGAAFLQTLRTFVENPVTMFV